MAVYEHWSSWFWVLVGVVITVASALLGLGTIAKPGAGFMPLLAGLLIVILAVVDLVFTYRAGRLSTVKMPQKEALRKMVSCVGALVVYSLLMPTMGFALTTMALMVVLFRYTEAVPWKSTLLAAFSITAATYFIFSRLGTELPKGFFF